MKTLAAALISTCTVCSSYAQAQAPATAGAMAAVTTVGATRVGIMAGGGQTAASIVEACRANCRIEIGKLIALR